MQTYTVKHPVNIRTSPDTGGGVIEKQAKPGRVFNVRRLLYPRPGEIWAQIEKQDNSDWSFSRQTADAYVCLVQGNNIFGMLTGEPDPTPDSGYAVGYAQGRKDGRAEAILAIQALP